MLILWYLARGRETTWKFTKWELESQKRQWRADELEAVPLIEQLEDVKTFGITGELIAHLPPWLIQHPSTQAR